MKIGFVGAGKVGTAFGAYLVKNGFTVAGYYSRTEQSAQNAAAATQSRLYRRMEDLVQECGMIFIATPDDVITSISMALTQIPAHWEQKTVIHMSGLHSSKSLKELSDLGATVGSLHPMLAFGEHRAAVEALKTTPFTLEGAGDHLAAVKDLLQTCGNQWTEIQSAQKALYHAAACTLSNYLVTLVDAGLGMLVSAGFEPEKANALAEPLVRRTVENIFSMGPEKAMTGPISRGDAGTVALHREKLSGYSDNWKKIYHVMGCCTADLALKAGRIHEKSYDLLKEALKHE